MGKARKNNLSNKIDRETLKEIIRWFFPALCILSVWGWVLLFMECISYFSVYIMLIAAVFSFLITIKIPHMIFSRRFMFIMLIFMLVGISGWLSMLSGGLNCKLYKCGPDIFCEKPINMIFEPSDCQTIIHEKYFCKTFKGTCLLLERN